MYWLAVELVLLQNFVSLHWIARKRIAWECVPFAYRVPWTWTPTLGRKRTSTPASTVSDTLLGTTRSLVTRYGPSARVSVLLVFRVPLMLWKVLFPLTSVNVLFWFSQETRQKLKMHRNQSDVSIMALSQHFSYRLHHLFDLKPTCKGIITPYRVRNFKIKQSTFKTSRRFIQLFVIPKTYSFRPR